MKSRVDEQYKCLPNQDHSSVLNGLARTGDIGLVQSDPV